MTIYQQPELDPKPKEEFPPVQIRLKPHFSTVPNAREKTASKKVDDISKHESNHDAKHEPKPQLERADIGDPKSKTINSPMSDPKSGQGVKPEPLKK